MEIYSEIFLNNLQKAKSKIVEVFNDEFYKNKDVIKSLIKQRWLLGKKPDGSLIGYYRSIFYAEEKYKKNPLAGFDNVDLIDTGALVNAITISMINNGFEVFSTDEKYNEIADKYGDENFNITDEEEKNLIDNISSITLEYLYNTYIL